MKNQQPLKSFGFTLAEILVTLGIIGVVAALTIPGLITNIQKKSTVAKLQRAISVMNQAYKLSYDSIGDATPQDVRNMGGEEYINTYWAPYLKIANICKKYTDCGYKKAQPFHYTDGTPTGHTPQNSSGKVVWFQTIEGFVYAVWYYQSSDTSIANFMYLDITGGSGPNTFGKDVFLIYRDIDSEAGGVVMPLCYKYNINTINASCKKGGHNSSNCCAEKIRRAGWKIEKDYPW